MQIIEHVTKYAKELERWVTLRFTEAPPMVTTERCCITLLNKKLILLHLDKIQEVIDIRFADILEYQELDDLPLILNGMVEKHGLQSIPTYWLLSFDDYQLFLIESLRVPEEEFKDALSWRIKNLINYPIEEAVIDYFALPVKKVSSHPMLVAACAKKTQLNQITKWLKKSKLNLTTIYIPELALRNLTALFENDEKSSAFIYFYDNGAILNITRQKDLYFTRRILFSTHPESNEIDYEKIGLEILRYFDYFQSQWRYPNPSRIFIASSKGNTADIVNILSKYLLLPVTSFPIKSFLVDSIKIESAQDEMILALGCALYHKDVKDAATGN